jgi:hypothetical protein
VWFVSRCCKQDKSKSLVSCETVASCSKDVYTEVEGSVAFETVIRQQLMKAQQTEKT